MPKTSGYSHYRCERCGKEAYLRDDDPSTVNWREVERITADGVPRKNWLCISCVSAHKSLATRHDAEFNAFLAEGKEEA